MLFHHFNIEGMEQVITLYLCTSIHSQMGATQGFDIPMIARN